MYVPWRRIPHLANNQTLPVEEERINPEKTWEKLWPNQWPTSWALLASMNNYQNLWVQWSAVPISGSDTIPDVKYPWRWRTQSLVLAGIQLGRFVNCRHYIGDHSPSSENLRLKTLRTNMSAFSPWSAASVYAEHIFSFCCNVTHNGQMHSTAEKVTEVQEQTMVESGQDFSQSGKITDVGSEAILLTGNQAPGANSSLL